VDYQVFFFFPLHHISYVYTATCVHPWLSIIPSFTVCSELSICPADAVRRRLPSVCVSIADANAYAANVYSTNGNASSANAKKMMRETKNNNFFFEAKHGINKMVHFLLLESKGGLY